MDEAAWKAFGEWVEQLRVRSGLQVGEVAERAGVSRVWLQEIRNGGRAGPSARPRSHAPDDAACQSSLRGTARLSTWNGRRRRDFGRRLRADA